MASTTVDASLSGKTYVIVASVQRPGSNVGGKRVTWTEQGKRHTKTVTNDQTYSGHEQDRAAILSVLGVSPEASPTEDNRHGRTWEITPVSARRAPETLARTVTRQRLAAAFTSPCYCDSTYHPAGH